MNVPTTAQQYDIPAVSLRAPRAVTNTKTFDEACRSVINFVGAALLLTLMFPVFGLIALCIRLDSPGPILFIQTRIGKDGKPFPFFKFRSMYTDAEKMLELLAQDNEASGPLFKMRRDPRITKAGRVIRRMSLDELPQLLNVIRGEMVLVGPRPALPREVSTYTAYEAQRLMVTPGLTGLWQVSGRSDLSFDDAIAYDLEYIAKRSVWFDFLILARTVPAVLLAKGAY